MKIPSLPVYVVYPKIFRRFRFIPHRMTLENCGRDVYRWLWWNWSIDVFVQVFDSTAWKKARINRLRYCDGVEVADITLYQKSIESKGHFTGALNHHRGVRKVDRFFLRVTGNI